MSGYFEIELKLMVGTSRTGVLRAATDRAAVLQALGEEIVEVSFFSLLSMLELII